MAIFGFIVGMIIMLYLTFAWGFIVIANGMFGSEIPVKYAVLGFAILAGFWILLFMNSPFTIAVSYEVT